MPTVPASDWLAPLELHVTIAVAAGVVYGARVDVYGGAVLGEVGVGLRGGV